MTSNITKKNGVNFGLILGVLSIVSTTLIYSIDLNLMTNIWLGIGLFLVNLIIGIVAVAKTKQAQGGFITFKEAFTTYFIAMVIGTLIGMVYMYILFNFIDPSAKETINQAAIEKTVTMMQDFGASTSDIKKTVEGMKEKDNFSLSSQLMSFAMGLIFNIIIALLVAVAMRKNKPEFE